VLFAVSITKKKHLEEQIYDSSHL